MSWGIFTCWPLIESPWIIHWLESVFIRAGIGRFIGGSLISIGFWIYLHYDSIAQAGTATFFKLAPIKPKSHFRRTNQTEEPFPQNQSKRRAIFVEPILTHATDPIQTHIFFMNEWMKTELFVIFVIFMGKYGEWDQIIRKCRNTRKNKVWSHLKWILR